MNSLMQKQYPSFQAYQSLRNQMMDQLEEADLKFQLPQNPTLGEICRDIGEVQVAYITSFKLFEQDFSFRTNQPEIAHDLSALKAWYAILDAELRETLQSLSETEIQTRQINRGHNFRVTIPAQLEIYKEALLIFYGKVSVYLHALGKEISEQWQEWVG